MWNTSDIYFTMTACVITVLFFMYRPQENVLFFECCILYVVKHISLVAVDVSSDSAVVQLRH